MVLFKLKEIDNLQEEAHVEQLKEKLDKMESDLKHLKEKPKDRITGADNLRIHSFEREISLLKNRIDAAEKKIKERKEQEAKAAEQKQKEEAEAKAEKERKSVIKVKPGKFEPTVIGETDIFESNKAWNVWSSFTGILTELKKNLETVLKKEDRFSAKEFFDFLNCDDPKKWIYKHHIQANNLEQPGIDIDRMIELELIPIEGLPGLISLYSDYQSTFQKVRSLNFVWPLQQLYNDETGEFGMSEIIEPLDLHFANYTTTKEQNAILEKFNQMAQLLNELSEMNIVRPKNGPNEIAMLDQYFIISKENNVTPFIVDSNLFSKHRLRHLRTPFKQRIKKYNKGSYFEEIVS